MSLIIDYPWYFVLLCLLLGIGYGAGLYLLRRRGASPLPRRVAATLFVLRTLAVASIAFLFLSPLIKRASDRKEKPIIVIAEDNSLSLNYCGDSAYHRDTFRRQVDELAEALSDDYDVQRATFGASVSLDANDASDAVAYSESATDMAQLLTDVGERYYHRNIGAMVVASDGIYNRGDNPLAAARDLTFPLYTVAMGDTTRYRDAAVAFVRYNRIAYLGNSFPVEVTVTAAELKGEQSTLTVSHNGKRLFTKPIAIDANHFSTTVSIVLDAVETGVNNYVVEISPLNGEHSLRNNKRIIAVDVIDGHQKIAIVGAVPHPDIAALKASLERNPNYEVSTFLAGDFHEKADSYSLLVLHQLPSKVRNANIDVAALLQSGTPAVFVLGSQSDLARFNALHAGLEVFSRIDRQDEATAAPAKEFAFFTLDGETADRIAHFPPLLSPFGDYKLGGNAQSLFTAKVGSVNTGRPLVAVAQAHDRRYAFVCGEGLWRWRLSNYQQDNSHADFDEMVDKLVTFTSMRFNKERLHVDVKHLFSQNEAVVFDAQFYNDSYEPVNTPDVTLAVRRTDGGDGGDGGDGQKHLLNRSGTGYSINLGAMPAGSYSYNAETKFNGQSFTASGSFVVEDIDLEALNTVADFSLLATLAATTGGDMVGARDILSIDELIRQRDDMATVIYRETSFGDMLNLPAVLIVIILLLTVEWVARKYNGEI